MILHFQPIYKLIFHPVRTHQIMVFFSIAHIPVEQSELPPQHSLHSSQVSQNSSSSSLSVTQPSQPGQMCSSHSALSTQVSPSGQPPASELSLQHSRHRPQSSQDSWFSRHSSHCSQAVWQSTQWMTPVSSSSTHSSTAPKQALHSEQCIGSLSSFAQSSQKPQESQMVMEQQDPYSIRRTAGHPRRCSTWRRWSSVFPPCTPRTCSTPRTSRACLQSTHRSRYNGFQPSTRSYSQWCRTDSHTYNRCQNGSGRS